jgi:hypothetical protein
MILIERDVVPCGVDPVPAAQRAIAHVAARSSGGPVDPDLRVTLNFHPVSMGGLLVLEAMGRDGRYRSQFETGTSNGGLTAYPGGGLALRGPLRLARRKWVTAAAPKRGSASDSGGPI